MSEVLAPAPLVAAPPFITRAASWLRKKAQWLIHWPQLITWYAVTVTVGTLGSYLAYGPLSSDAWRQWYPIRRPWAVDALRLLISALLALFILWALGVLDRHNDRLREKMLRGWFAIVPPAILIGTLVCTFTFLPWSFIAELTARRWQGARTFRAIWVPYFPYALYTVALWFGVVTPPFIVIVTRMRLDFRRWRWYRAEFEHVFDALPKKAAAEDALIAAQVALQNYVLRLKQVGERTLPVIMAVAAILAYEQTTPSQNTALHGTQSWAKVALWFLMGPAVITCITIVTFGYQSAVRTAEATYRRLLAQSWGDAKLAEKIMGAREKLMWQGNGGSFIVSILKSASVLVVLIATGTAYIVKTVNGKNGWWGIFIPDQIFEFVKQIFS
jgi:hypothetical protein